MTSSLNEWVIDAFSWLRAAVGSEFLESVTLVTPTEQFLPIAIPDSEQACAELLDRIVELLGLTHIPMELRLVDYGSVLETNPLHAAKLDQGREAWLEAIEDGGGARVLVDSSAQGDLQLLVTLICVQLANFIVANSDLPPGGQDYYAVAVEFVAIALGFGVFIANRLERPVESESYGGTLSISRTALER